MDLKSTADVIKVLGGTVKVAEITGRKYMAVWNWGKAPTFPASTYLILKAELAKRGEEAPIRLWRMEVPVE